MCSCSDVGRAISPCLRFISLAPASLQPLPLDSLYNRASFPPHADETNTSRMWLHLDENLNIVKREHRNFPV